MSDFKLAMKQEQVDELVERFYQRLTQDPYFRNMFAERKVDLDRLKERQKVFIARLANSGPLQDGQEEVRQVRERHSFGVHPERAQAWFHHMKATIGEMKLEPEVSKRLLEKIQFLVNRMVET